MIRAYRSEWVKMARMRHILAVWGTMVALMVLFTALILANAGTAADRAAAAAKAAAGERASGPVILISDLEKPDGLTFGLNVGGNILGIISLVFFAGNLAGEYGHGTLKVILVREPRRLGLLAGKLAALFSFAVAGISAAALAEVVTATAIGAARGFDMSAWWTLPGLEDAAALVGRLCVSTLLWGALGTMLAILLRSGPAAIGLGIGYIIVGEGLLSLALPDLVRYLPGQAVAAFVAAGKANPSAGLPDPLDLQTAVILSVAYVFVFLSVAGVLFRQRDVSA